MEKSAFTRGSFYVVFRSLILEDISGVFARIWIVWMGIIYDTFENQVCDFILATQIGLVHIQEAAATPPMSGTREVSLFHTLLNEDNKYIQHK